MSIRMTRRKRCQRPSQKRKKTPRARRPGTLQWSTVPPKVAKTSMNVDAPPWRKATVVKTATVNIPQVKLTTKAVTRKLDDDVTVECASDDDTRSDEGCHVPNCNGQAWAPCPLCLRPCCTEHIIVHQRFDNEPTAEPDRASRSGPGGRTASASNEAWPGAGNLLRPPGMPSFDESGPYLDKEDNAPANVSVLVAVIMETEIASVARVFTTTARRKSATLRL